MKRGGGVEMRELVEINNEDIVEVEMVRIDGVCD